MPLIKTSLLPHSPLLIPEIGRANHNFLKKTIDAYQEISDFLKQQNIDTLIVLTPHGLNYEDSFNINVAPEMNINLKTFGFIPPNSTITGNMILADKIKNDCRYNHKIRMSSESELDHGSAIPIYLLAQDTNFKIITISPPKNPTLEKLIAFGKDLEKSIHSSNKNIAIIASGDLSHRLKKKSPGGYSPKGAKFDNKLIEYLSNSDTAIDNIIKIDNNLIESAGECGLRPITVLLGVLSNLDWQAKVLAYQDDFGVGYLSMDFNFKYGTR